MTLDVAAGWSALLAAVATVVGAATLVQFFRRGEPWGRINDASSVVLMLALIPVALLVAQVEAGSAVPSAAIVSSIGIGAMLAVAILQALLVARRVTYQQTKRQVLVGGAVVGLWFVLIGLFARQTSLDGFLAWLAIAAGVGYIGIGYAFFTADERHPIAVGGGALALVASVGFLGILGIALVSGRIAGPYGNL